MNGGETSVRMPLFFFPLVYSGAFRFPEYPFNEKAKR